MKNQIKMKSEKGSITLFVLVTMLFFVTILILSYAGQANKINEQKKQIAEIQREYEAEKDIEEAYYEAEKNLPVTIILYLPDGKIYNVDEWTNQDLTLKIFYPGGYEDDYKYYYIDGVRTKYEEKQKITKNCEIKVEYDRYKTEVVVSKIDKELPTVDLGTNGGNYLILSEKTTQTISTTLTSLDIGGSELNILQYAWSTSNTTEPTTWINFTNGSTISKTDCTGGTYYLWTKVTDAAGNRATSIKVSNAYIVRYQVIYNANGGTGAPGGQEKTHGTNLKLSSTKPTRTGYTFKGWATTGSATTAQYQPEESYTTNQAITLYAVWNINSYTLTMNPQGTTATQNYGTTKSVTAPTQSYQVSFNGNGGTTPTTQISVRNFSKWTLSGAGSISSSTANPTVYTYGEGNATLTASYNQTGNAITLPTSTRTGYTFNGWYKESSLTNLAGVAGEKYSPTGNITLYAKWTINTYTITFNGNGGNSTSYKYNYGTKITSLPTSSRTQYVFTGWYTSAQQNAGTRVTSVNITGNLTYYAHWVQIPNISYESHITNIGWQGLKSNGAISGTVGQNLAVQCIRANLNYTYSDWIVNHSIEYEVYAQNERHYPSGSTVPQQGAAVDGQNCGTTGQNLALGTVWMAIKDKSTGKDSTYFDVWYRVHVSDKGWLGWTRRGSQAGGSIVSSYQVQAMQAVITLKDAPNPDGNYNAIGGY